MWQYYFAQLIKADFALNKGGNANKLLENALTIVYFVAGIVAVITLIIAGFLYATSAGDPGKAKTAKNAILYSVIGLIAVLLAFMITTYVRSVVG